MLRSPYPIWPGPIPPRRLSLRNPQACKRPLVEEGQACSACDGLFRNDVLVGIMQRVMHSFYRYTVHRINNVQHFLLSYEGCSWGDIQERSSQMGGPLRWPCDNFVRYPSVVGEDTFGWIRNSDVEVNGASEMAAWQRECRIAEQILASKTGAEVSPYSIFPLLFQRWPQL